MLELLGIELTDGYEDGGVADRVGWTELDRFRGLRRVRRSTSRCACRPVSIEICAVGHLGHKCGMFYLVFHLGDRQRFVWKVGRTWSPDFFSAIQSAMPDSLLS